VNEFKCEMCPEEDSILTVTIVNGVVIKVCDGCLEGLIDNCCEEDDDEN